MDVLLHLLRVLLLVVAAPEVDAVPLEELLEVDRAGLVRVDLGEDERGALGSLLDVHELQQAEQLLALRGAIVQA